MKYEIRNVLEKTEITLPALARKLRVSKEEIHVWLNTGEVPKQKVRELEDFLNPPKPVLAKTPVLDSQLVFGDCREALKTLPEKSVDLVLTDIPYGIGMSEWDVLHDNTNSAYLGASPAQKKLGKGFQKRRKPINGWSETDKEIPRKFQKWCDTWTPLLFRVLKPGGSLIIFSGRRYAHRALVSSEDAGFALRDMLAWVKPAARFRAQRIASTLRKRALFEEAQQWEGWRVGNLAPTYEPVLWLFKPYNKTLVDNVLSYRIGAYNLEEHERLAGNKENILHYGLTREESGWHETQKPLALMKHLISLVTLPGQMVLDPFAGSGSTALAARTLGRRYFMIESDPDIYSKMKERINN